MENTQNTPWYAKEKTWQTIREFFAWILCCYFIYQNKELDKEKTKILQAQIEIMSKSKETEMKSLEILQKAVNEKSNKNSDVEYNYSSNTRR